MVLLTSSSISVAISSAVVCLFTFLLFLSGYVLQQQSVRSLQAALHPPPRPTPTLPVYFQDVDRNLAEAAAEEQALVQDDVAQVFRTEDGPSQVLGVAAGGDVHRDAPSDDVEEEKLGSEQQQQALLIQSSSISTSPEDIDTTVQPTAPEPSNPFSLAYIQALTTPSQICSALLFFKDQSALGDPNTSRLLLYPSHWEETASNEAYTSVLALMRLAADESEIVLYPVPIVEQDTVNMERQLVSYISTTQWPHYGLLYLRNPGLALDVSALDRALLTSQHPSLLPRNWTPLPSLASQFPTARSPITTLLITQQGAFTPRGSTRRLIAEAITSHSSHHEQEMDVEVAARSAAYVVFDEGELEHRRTEKEWYGGVFEGFERGRAEVCQGVSFQGEKGDLKKRKKKRRRRSWM